MGAEGGTKARREARLGTGVPGLDEVLAGGFTPARLYLIEGSPGAGKTTLALQFLMEGARSGERAVYVTLSETEGELRAMADSHGWNLEGVTMLEHVPSEEALRADEQYTMFHPSEVELSETIRTILGEIEKLGPSRVAFDSLTELRLLAGGPLRYRRQLLAMKRYLSAQGCTVLLLDDLTEVDRDLQVQSIVNGIVSLEQLAVEYGSERRRLRVIKYRGTRFRGGYHDYTIRTGGIEVFPRLVAVEDRRLLELERLPTGIASLDALLGGGVERGTSTLLVGAAGTGKSSLAAQIAASAAERGLRAAIFTFDESANTLLSRTDGIGIPLRARLDEGAVEVEQIDPAEVSPGEFAHRIREAAVSRDVAVVVIDSLNGYLNAMPGERHLIVHLHELLTFLGQRGVATLLVTAHHGLVGPAMTSPVDASYLADSVVLLRYFELRGEVRQAISVMKKRGSRHERTIREFSMDDRGIHVGPPLREFRGVLTGVPVSDDDRRPREDAAAR
jgi:circadian clock protein KaiC